MTAIGPFKVTQGHRFCYGLKADITYYLLSRTVSELPWRGQITGIDSWGASNYLVRSLHRWTLDCEICPKTRNIAPSCGAQNISIHWTVYTAWITWRYDKTFWCFFGLPSSLLRNKLSILCVCLRRYAAIVLSHTLDTGILYSQRIFGH